MTTKGTATVDSTGSLSLAQLPPQISLASPLLTSIIRLPPDPLIAYTVFEPSGALDPSLHLSAIESARRSLVSGSRSILKSLLFTVKILPRLPLLYVFAISSSGQRSPPHEALLNLNFDGLVSSTCSVFSLKGLYPCGVACSVADEPCPNCLAVSSDLLDPPFLPQPLARQLPRSPLRTVYAQLIYSIREFVSDRLGDIASSPDLLPTFRCQDGIVLAGADGFSDWGTGWVHRSRNRRLVFCHFEVHFSHSCLLLHPILRPVDLLPLSRSTAIIPGSPIRLLPLNTPAYYLGPYTGPTNVLTTQFEDSLRGLGVGGWKDLFHKPTWKHSDGLSYIVAWVAVQNKRGEEKGISVVWPLSLCLAFLPESPQAKLCLQPLPELPASLRLHSSVPPPSSTIANVPPISPQDIKPTLNTILTIPPVGLPPRAAIHSARSLQPPLSRVEITVDSVSREVSGFVDYVAKERERERERIKRERDNHTNPISSSQPLIIHANGLEREQTPFSPLVIGATMGDNQGANNPPSAEARDPFDGLDTHLEDKAQDTPATREQSPEPTGPYEMYPSFNSSWTQNADQFPPLEIDYEMGFGMGINPVDRSAGVSDETGITTDLDNIYGVFTDDDFNFFDRPNLDESYLGQAPSVGLFRDPLVLQHETIPLFAVPTSPTNGVLTHHGHGAGNERPTSPSPSPLTSTLRVDPLALIDSKESMSPPSISSHPAPSTPRAILDLERPSATHGSSVFDPIWFSPMHRTSDYKYASGKFSLPGQQTVRVATTPQHDTGWRFRYNDATDPRISVVRKLVAPLLKHSGNDVKGGNALRDGWVNALSEREGEDWSDMESIDDRSTGFIEAADISVLLDRPCTPPSHFTPLGPSLLDFQFHHSHLLPLSRPLHSPSSALVPTGLQGFVPTISVPTPVSPPAMLGEKLRSWEAAASLLVREVVENALWAESWQVNNRHAFRTTYTLNTCQGDVSQLASALDTLEDSHTSLEMGTLFDLATGSLQPHQGDTSSSLQIMEPPLFSVGKGKNVVNLLPSAIRFWEKTGLHPVGGQKNVNAFVLYEGEGTEMFEHASRWFKQISIAYTSKNFGSHESGCFTDGSSPGSIVEVRFDSIRRFLPTFTSKIETPEHLVFYVVTPLSMMTLASSNFRQMLSAAKRAVKGSPAASTLFQFVPESMVSDSANEDQGTISTFVTSVYDRLLKPVRRGMVRPLFDHEESVRALVQSPAFVLSRPQHPRPIFLRQAPARSLDTMDRHLLLHVGYSTSTCGKWIMASCIDQRGGGHDLGLWLNQPDDGIPEEFVVNKVWEFAIAFTKRTDVEWRVAFSKAGSIDEREMEAWHSKLSLGISIRGTSPIHISLLSVTSDTSRVLLSPTNTSQGLSGLAKAAPSMRFQDVSSTTYALINTTPVTLFSPLSTHVFFAIENVVPELDDMVRPGIGIRPLSSATLIRVPADTDYSSVSMLHVHLFLTLKSAGSHLHISDEDTHLDIIHNFHELTVLGDARWRLGGRANPILPFHLSCLEVMDRVLVEEPEID